MLVSLICGLSGCREGLWATQNGLKLAAYLPMLLEGLENVDGLPPTLWIDMSNGAYQSMGTSANWAKANAFGWFTQQL